MRTTQALAEMKRLAKDARANLYRRIELAETVLKDIDWIAKTHGGSDLQAMDALSAEYFPDLNGYVSLGKLLCMYRDVPEAKWKEVRYDVAAVEVLYDDSRETTKEERGKKTSWKSIAEERGKKIEQLEAQVKQLLQANAKLREEVDELRDKAAHIQGRLDEVRARRQLVDV